MARRRRGANYVPYQPRNRRTDTVSMMLTAAFVLALVLVVVAAVLFAVGNTGTASAVAISVVVMLVAIGWTFVNTAGDRS